MSLAELCGVGPPTVLVEDRKDVVPSTPQPRAATITPLPNQQSQPQQLKRGSTSPAGASHSTPPCFPCPFVLALPEVPVPLPGSLAHTSFEPSPGILSVSQEDPYFFTSSGGRCIATLFLAFQTHKNSHEILLSFLRKDFQVSEAGPQRTNLFFYPAYPVS